MILICLILVTSSRPCRVCGEPARYHCEFHRGANDICLAPLCSAHALMPTPQYDSYRICPTHYALRAARVPAATAASARPPRVTRPT